MSDTPIEIDVTTCLDCPFATYTGGIDECMHPGAVGLRRVPVSETGRLKGCPLPSQPVTVRAKSIFI